MGGSVEPEYDDGGAKEAAAAGPPCPAGLSPDAPITELTGVGESIASRLATVSVATVFDLVTFFPRRYRAL